jgi:uncharacterized protein (TIGR04255 family)
MKLLKAPLKEVIFEVFWDLQIGADGQPIDKGFEFALGIFASKVKNTHPIVKKNIPDNFPLKLIGKTTHQFWQNEMKWPVVQIGAGVMAVNDTDESYDWENNYFDLIKNSLKSLFDSYDNNIQVNHIQLKYIDAVDLPTNVDCGDFLRENLRIELTNNFNTLGTQTAVQINQNFLLKDGSSIGLSINDAVNDINQQKSIVWTTTVLKQGSFSQNNIIEWLQYAHTHSSDMFKNMVSPQFYQTFL